MDTTRAINSMVIRSGKSKTAIAGELGKSRQYIGALTRRGGGIGTDTMARLASVCGYRLALLRADHPALNEGDTIIIDE